MRKAPFRPNNEISQTYNSGVCTLYKQRDTARPGQKPRPELERKSFLRYEEQRMGLTRYYVARQVDVEVERVIRVPKGPATSVPTPRDVVRTENGALYQVYLIQTVPGVWPASLDLTLVRYVRGGPHPSQPAAVPPSPKGEGLTHAGRTKGGPNEMV